MTKPELSPKRFRKTPIALAIASTLTVTAHAQQAGLEHVKAQPDVIEVVGTQPTRDPASVKFARPLLDTAQTINVIPESLIEDRAATTLRDVLRNVSGISMQAGEGGNSAGDQLSIRGYSAMTDIFVDNVRDFGGYTRDPFNLEQIEVVKGPASDYSGRGSTGGSINLVSKAPQLADSTASNLSLGSDSFNRLTLDMNRTLESADNTAVRLNLMYHDQDIAGRDQISNKRWGIAPSIAFGLQTDTQVTLSLFHLEQDNVPDYGIPWVPATNVPLAAYANEAAPVDFDNWYGLKNRDFEELGTSMFTAQVDHRLNETMRLRNVTRWGLTERDSMITAPRFVSDTSTDIRRRGPKYRDQEDEIISNQTNLVLDLNGGAWEHRVLLGTEFTLEGEKRYTQQATGSDSPETDLFNPTPDDPYLENYQRTGTASTADSNSVAVYVSDSIKINDQWQINGGLRWDRFALEYTPDGSAMMERTDTMTSYRAGVVYKPVEEGSIYLGYGTSFNPTAETLSISTSSRQPGIANLKPEENRSMELGTKWEVLNRQLLLTAAIFRTEKTNARTQDPNDPNDVLVLEGEQLVQGLELGLAGRVGDRISLHAGYTYLDAEITESKDATEVGNALGNSPEHSVNVWSTYQLVDNLEFGLGAQFVDERFNNTANTRVAPSYWVYEASANYAFSDSLGFQLNIQNLTDEKYVDYVGGGHFIPGLGRVVLFSTHFSF
jgi:catecholate siderophore receptor